MKMKNILKCATIVAAMALTASCASKKSIGETTQLNPNTTTGTATTGKNTTGKTTDKNAEKSALQFVERVAANKLSTDNIVASGDFTLQMGSKDITVPAKLSMRKDECIRIQLLMPILRSELARLEFTPDYVLLVDRYHKEYIKAAYSEVSFLANNGISFYSLQALFWNQLTAPGAKHVEGNELKKFDVTTDNGNSVSINLAKGNFTYSWGADPNTALINNAEITYRSAAHGTSTLKWQYGNFKSVGTKRFPTTQQFGFNTNYGGKDRSAQVTIEMSTPKTSADWDAKTEVSGKYRKVEVEALLRKLTSLQ